MRPLFLLLVLASLAFYVWTRYFAPPEAVSDSAPLSRQIQPERLRLLSEAELARMEPPKPKPAPRAEVGPTPTPPAVLACREWGSFTLADAPRAQKVLAPLNLGARLVAKQVEETANWWVFMPPQGSRFAALRKANELRTLGVTEFFIVTDEGPLRWSLSLGVFRAEDAAQEHLAALRRRGVRTARVAARTLQVPKVWLQIENVDTALGARMNEIALAFPGSELRDCVR